MLRKSLLLCVIFALSLLCGCQSKEDTPPALPETTSAEEPVTMVVATDLHYISPRLTDGGEMFQQVVDAGDGKVTEYIGEITDTFAQEVIAIDPDALILSGDLTFNGAYISHLDLISVLNTIREAGIPILVLPGNHDLNNPSAARFSGSSYQLQRSITAKEFQKEYAAFGYEEAISAERTSGSCLYAIRADLWVLMVDANSAGTNTLSEKTLAWIEEQLQQAEACGARVIAVSHQNLLAHNALFTAGYRLEQGDSLQSLYQDYGVLCNLSGHMHLQHILTAPLPEIVTSSLSVFPNQYGVIEFDGTALTYQTERLDVSSWAIENGKQTSDLLHFSDYSAERMRQSARREVMEVIENNSTLSYTQKDLLAETFAQLNTAYFAGDRVDVSALENGLSLWEEQPSSFYRAYIQSILAEADTEHHSIVLSAEEAAYDGPAATD